ncbi:Uncharacterized conserved protein, DUF885 familyt [Parasphingorhabdus marina DSM 22363]|uniref:Uncharacterized conserved protein, DUF885 familyt n=1 Tax=Parasphingorhabdus marina DSM 22363 TaxID=1123272 RepID=A0A1N6CTI3_9SPHN|nr:DUF885 domain-containing protein [Parasphingorhabdus marina]SIN61777.1 Uncharacterized conserved protein, DUF885 familyt [Parasphingorhabdus marina DSM 22363]
MLRKSLLLLAGTSLIVTGCASVSNNRETATTSNQTVANAQEMTEGEKLKALFTASDEDNLKRNPISGIFRGDLRYADQFGDYITDEYIAGEKAAQEKELAELRKIDRSKLSATDKIAYDVFEYNKKRALIGYSDEILALSNPRPVNHFSGFHTFYPNFASGKGGAPFKTVADYENNLKRHAGYILLGDRAIERFREGIQSGVFETRLTIENVIEQLATQNELGLEKTPFMGPVRNFPEDFSDADKTRLTAEYEEMTKKLFAGNQRMHDFLKNEYLPYARTETGLNAMKGGELYYDYLIEGTTTLPLKAGEIHELGLKEVARIKTEMEAIKDEVGFSGTLSDFFEHFRTDPKFHPESREALTQGYYDLGKKVDEKISTQFKVLPKSPLEIRPYDKSIEKFQAGGSYQSGTPDGSRAGVFYFNAYDLPSRNTSGMTTLYLHEGAPGHHFQISLAQENTALPNFMRFGGNTAYVEGWALYSEKLGFPMGLYDDPYQRFGHLDDEMLRAMRLVVDTGLHSKGWSREKAIKYMLDNSSMGETDATAEVERYIAIPSQALAYKIGALTIQRLKDQAETELGTRFDPREFHDQVLNTGALPMTVLEKKISDWIAASK